MFLITILMIACFFPINPNIKRISNENRLTTTDNGIKVVAFNTIVADWANNLLGDLGFAEAIVRGSTDIHTYTYTSADIQKVADADIFIKMGVSGLEPNVDDLIDAAKTVNPSLYVFTLKNSTPDPNYGITLKYDPLIDDMNGHFWMSPENAKLLVKKICANFTDYNPTNQSTFESNRDIYLNKLDQLLWRIGNFSAWYYDTMKVVVMHPAFFYLFDLLGINRTAAIEKAEGIEPSAADIAAIIDLMNINDVNLIVTDPQHSDEQVIEIARQTGSEIAYLTPLLGVYGLETYIDMIDYDLCALHVPKSPPEEPFKAFQWLWVILGGLFAVLVITSLIWRYRGVSQEESLELDKNIDRWG
ncbi:MAG: metal ABC transporter substrate-binding protein [Candidatus Helarchaeota archaeon]